MRRRDRELAARRLAALTAARRPPPSPPGRAGGQPPEPGSGSTPASTAGRADGPPAGPPAGSPGGSARGSVAGWTPEHRATSPDDPGTPGELAADPLAPPERHPSDPATHPTRVATSHAVRIAARAYATDHPAPDETVGGTGRRRAVDRRRTVLRWSLTPRTAAVGSVAVLLLAGAVALHAARSAPGAPVVLPTPNAAGPAASSPVAIGEVVVDVVGAVAAPGVVRLPTGSRVVDAVAAAGGATAEAELSALNLARVLVDGEQIVVSRPGQPAPATAGSGATGAALVDLNSADLATLDTLPGVGPVLAQRIVDARAKHPFSSVDELADVPGIGPALLARLRPLVRP